MVNKERYPYLQPSRIQPGKIRLQTNVATCVELMKFGVDSPEKDQPRGNAAIACPSMDLTLPIDALTAGIQSVAIGARDIAARPKVAIEETVKRR